MSIFGKRKSAPTKPSEEQPAKAAEAAKAGPGGKGAEAPAKGRRRARQSAPAPMSARKAKAAARAAGADGPIRDTRGLVGIESMYRSGLAESAPGVFSHTLEFSDISYEHERADVQDDIFNKYHDLLAMYPAGTCVQVNLINVPKPTDAVTRIFREEGPTAPYARAYNDLIEERQRSGRTEFVRKNYLTYAVEASDDAEAERQLATFGNHAAALLQRMRSRTHRLTGEERIDVIHGLIHGAASKRYFTYGELTARGPRRKVADWLAPSWAAYTGQAKLNRDTLTLPCGLVRTYHIRGFGSELSDSAIRTIRALPVPMNISLILRPQNVAKMLKAINENIATVHAEMADYERSLGKQGANITHLPPALEAREADAIELMDFIREDNQHIAYFQGTITVYAQSEGELEVYDKMLAAERERFTLDICRLPLDQEDGLTTSLPLATPRLRDKYRSLATAEAATMIPFASQNITDDPAHSYFLGVDTVSGELITVDPDKTKSPHMWVFGFTGAGKGMQVNSILEALVLMHPKDKWDSAKNGYVCSDERAPQIHVIDFHSEYAAHARELGGAVEKYGAGQRGCINLMDLADDAGKLTRQTVAQSAETFIALMASVIGRNLDEIELTTIDRAIQDMYAPYIGTAQRPTLNDLWATLEADARPEAQALAAALEVYVRGSFAAFSGQTNIEVDDQYNCYDCSEVGKQMQTLAMLAILQHVKLCTYANHRAGRPTYLFVEEVQVMFGNEWLVNVLDSFFSELRKYGLHMVCITQLPERVLSHQMARNLFQNSSIFVFLPQQALNADLLAKEFSLSVDQRDKILPGAQAGTGLVIADGVTISMSNRIPKDNPLYAVWNTDPYAAQAPADLAGSDDAADSALLSEIGISAATAERFAAAGITTVAQAAGLDEAAMRALPGVGPKSASELKAALAAREG